MWYSIITEGGVSAQVARVPCRSVHPNKFCADQYEFARNKISWQLLLQDQTRSCTLAHNLTRAFAHYTATNKLAAMLFTT